VDLLIGQLASDDPSIREDAEGKLMDLKRADLPMLRGAAMSQGPLLPGQVLALREIVTQVFLEGEPYMTDLDAPGFLGIHCPEGKEGLLVLERIPGFPGFRYLRRGDMILGLLDWPRLATGSWQDFVNSVAKFYPGEVLRLSVERGGRMLVIAVPLDFRPSMIGGPGVTDESQDPWLVAREARAQAYWESEFAGIDPNVPAISMQVSAIEER
jgi:hypothetical protein